jgi:transporter family-2 protein
VFSVPKWQLTGGLLGAIYVLVMVLAVPKIGVATTIVSVILGQVLISGVIDHFGLFGSKQIPFDWQRGVAAILLGVSLFLIKTWRKTAFFRNGDISHGFSFFTSKYQSILV